MGKKSRDKGARFERHCAKHVLPELTGHPHWKRTQRGDAQHRGDLVPCDKEGREVTPAPDLNCPEVVECKVRNAMCNSEVRGWVNSLFEMGVPNENFMLLIKQDRGLVWVGRGFYRHVGFWEPFGL